MPKEAQPKRNVYVGGLEEQVNEEILHAAFVPFGDIVEVGAQTPVHAADSKSSILCIPGAIDPPSVPAI